MRYLLLTSKLLPVAILLIGCAATERHAYEGAPRADSELAVVETFNAGDARSKATAYLMMVKTTVGSYYVGHPDRGFSPVAKLLPGEARLVVYCSLPYGSASPLTYQLGGVGPLSARTYTIKDVSVDLKPGKRYHLKCEPSPDYRARTWLDDAE